MHPLTMMMNQQNDNEQPDVKPHSKHLGRELAMQYLFQCDLRGELPDDATWKLFCEQAADTHHLHENRLFRKGREFAEKLFNGVAVNRERIDETIRARAENWEFERLALVERNVLRIAVYEMLFLDDIPPVVSIDEAVSIVRDYSGEEACGFINGILNGVKDALKRPSREKAAPAQP